MKDGIRAGLSSRFGRSITSTRRLAAQCQVPRVVLGDRPVFISGLTARWLRMTIPLLTPCLSSTLPGGEKVVAMLIDRWNGSMPIL